MCHHRHNGSSTAPELSEWISLREASRIGGLSSSHLRLLVSRGDIWGARLGRNWLRPPRRSRNTWPPVPGRGQRPRNVDIGPLATGGTAIVDKDLSVAPGLVLRSDDMVLKIADLLTFAEGGCPTFVPQFER